MFDKRSAEPPAASQKSWCEELLWEPHPYVRRPGVLGVELCETRQVGAGSRDTHGRRYVQERLQDTVTHDTVGDLRPIGFAFTPPLFLPLAGSRENVSNLQSG